MKHQKPLTENSPRTRSWTGGYPRPAFRGYPIATLAFYGPTDKLATKVVASITLTENNQVNFLQRWFSDGELDVRHDSAIGEQVLAFFKAHAPRSSVVVDRIIGCPHEEGTDYPEGSLVSSVRIGRGVTGSPTSASNKCNLRVCRASFLSTSPSGLEEFNRYRMPRCRSQSPVPRN